MIERIAERVPNGGLVRIAPIGAFVGALLGAGSMFAAVMFGSVLWLAIGLGLFFLAAVAWHIAEIRR
ncbi:MAG TPA: hypothetical protein VMM81_08700 [Acidimicrobiia bacterium]|nr:hypothetical protein [Acidimicrobiia bacterium]